MLLLSRLVSLWIGVLLLFAAAPHAQNQSIEAFFDRFTDEWMRLNTDLAASSRYFRGEEQDRVERQLTSSTAENQRRRIQVARRGLTELRAFDRVKLSQRQRLSADVMAWQLDSLVRSEPYLDFDYSLEQFQGVNVRLVNTLTVQHQLRTERDAANYLARLAVVSTRMGEAVAEARRRDAQGIIPPRFILAATIAQMEQFVGTPAAMNPLVVSFDQRLGAAKVVDDARRSELRGEAEKIVTADVYPAWKVGIELLRSQLTRATDTAGLSRLKGGTDAYQFRVARSTSTSISAEEVHQTGLREVARLEQEMDGLFRRLGRANGTIQERIEQLKRDLAYPDSAEGRAAIMADIDGMIRDAERRSMLVLDYSPKTPVIAQPYPEFRWASAAASYTAPPLDGSRPGIFQMPLRADQLTRFQLRSVVYHETVPGHHFQVALFSEDTSLPRFRRMRAFGPLQASTEGWGLYAERLAIEEGWYADDVEGHIGALDGLLFRARRLVVDTGLHTKGWTRQQAIDYGIEPSEVDRYVVNPGQATSYMIGQLKIVELREKARAALGPRFSLKAFHNLVLSLGPVPLPILEVEVDRYISETKQR